MRSRQRDAMARRLPLSTLIAISIALLVVAELHGEVTQVPLTAWALFVGVANAIRLALHRWHAQVPATDLMQGVAALVAGGAWAALPFLLPSGPSVLDGIVALLIGAIAIEGIMAYGGAPRLSALYCLPILVGQAVEFALVSGTGALPLLVAWLAAGTVGLLFWRNMHAARLARHRNSIEAAALAAERDALFEATDRGVLALRDGVIIACNHAVTRLFGFTREELVGKPAEVLGDTTTQVDGGVARIERRRHREGHVLEVEIGVQRFAGPDGEVIEFQIFNDVSQRERLERDLTLYRERVQNWLDTLPSGLWDYDLATGRLFNSRRIRQLLGQAEAGVDDIAADRLFFHHEAVHPEDRARVADARMDFLLNGTNFDEQYRLQTVDGGRRWVHETARVICDSAGQAVRYTGSISDVTAVNAMQEKLLSSEAFHRHLIEASNSLIWRADEQGVLTYVNELGARELYGYDAAEMIGKPLISFCAPESAREVLPRLGAERAGPIRNLEMVHLNKLGRRVYVSINAVPILDEGDGHYTGSMGINTDITYLKRRERAFQDSVRMQRLIFDSAGEGIVMMRNGRVHRANQAFADLVGATIGDIVARALSGWFEEPLEWEAVERQLAQLGNVIKVEQQLRRSDGRKLWVAVTGRVAGTGEDGRTYIWVFADISARKEQEEQSWYRANHDELTGLPNRRLLQDRFEQSLVRAKRESMRMGVLMLDLDGFKEINDLYGHNAGDEVLRQVARRLTENVRQLDTVARLGGDEFVIVLHQVASAPDAELMAARLIEQVRAPVEFGGKTFAVSTSVGVSLFPDAGDTIAGLMHAADMAMYAAKASGKDTYKVAQSPVKTPRRANLGLGARADE